MAFVSTQCASSNSVTSTSSPTTTSVGADPEVHKPWLGPYDIDTTFHEPFVLFGYLAAVTSLELVTGIIILPQRQTALVAKQGGGGRPPHERAVPPRRRPRLNAVEYEALDKEFTNRGTRMEEQIDLLRRLFTERSVTFDGRFERVTAAGLAPLPVQRPLPIWIGGSSPRAYERIGRLADGWFPMTPPGPKLDEARAVVDEAAHAAGRDPAALGMEGRVSWTDAGIDKLVDQLGRWRDAGATHVSVNTMNARLGPLAAHLDTLATEASALGLPSSG